MNAATYETQPRLPRIVIVGGGFGGLYAARSLRRAPAEITVIDRTNHHVFQPLLYQVATASLSADQIAAPIRSVLHTQSNAEVILGEVKEVDTAQRLVQVDDRSLPYDYLILATGSRHSYFAHPEWEQFAPGLKALSDAVSVRRNILLAFEAAEIEPDPVKRSGLLTFVIVGGGPTGVEMAGQIAEIAHHVLTRDFRHIDPKLARVLLVEAGPRILSGFHQSLADASQRYLEKMGVEIRTGKPVQNVEPNGITLDDKFIPTGAVVWAAGNMTSPVGKWTGAPTDKAGRVFVAPDLSVPEHPEIFVLGDAMHLEHNGKLLPGVAQVAIQQGKYVAKLLLQRLKGNNDFPPFHYLDKGNMATVGRRFAIYELDELRLPNGRRLLGPIRMSGLLIWLLWLGIHITYLIGFANRFLVMIQWGWAYLTWHRGARIIPEETSDFPATATVKTPAAQ